MDGWRVGWFCKGLIGERWALFALDLSLLCWFRMGSLGFVNMRFVGLVDFGVWADLCVEPNRDL